MAAGVKMTIILLEWFDGQGTKKDWVRHKKNAPPINVIGRAFKPNPSNQRTGSGVEPDLPILKPDI